MGTTKKPAAQKKSQAKKQKLRILKSLSGILLLNYSVGEEVEFDNPEQVKILLESGLAEKVK